MFENLVNQEASKVIAYDIKHNLLPRAILFSGEESSGKLTAAFETSRILNCKNKEGKISFNCNCSSCLQQKALVSTNVMLLGPRDCFLEIAAAKEIFLKAYANSESFIDASRYFFLRSVRKLTLRFNGILWEGDRNLNKIGSLIEEINENLEILDFPKELPPNDEVKEICEKLITQCKKLESDYLYNSIPVKQIRNLEEWTHTKAEEGKKIIIIENAERMQASVRNALLKILEEPPEDCVFILLTSKRNAVMQTILSRVRTYNFRSRTLSQQEEVLKRVFHNDLFNGSIDDYLLTFLPVTPTDIKVQSDNFYNAIARRQIPDLSEIVKKCENFNPRIELKLFLNNIAYRQRKLQNTQIGCEFCARNMKNLRQCWDNITLYNQNSVAALDILLRDMSVLNVQMQGVMNKSL